MEHSIIQWNVRGFQTNFEELALLSRRYKPAVFGLQETFLKGTDCSLFVDDFALCVSGKTLNRVERAMQLCVNSV